MNRTKLQCMQEKEAELNMILAADEHQQCGWLFKDSSKNRKSKDKS